MGIKIKFSYGEFSAEVEVADDTLQGSSEPNESTIAAACGRLENFAVNVTGVATVREGLITSNGSIAQADKQEAGKAAAKAAANEALSRQILKAAGGYRIECPTECRDFVFFKMVPTGPRESEDAKFIDNTWPYDNVWQCTARQPHRFYYGCARDLKGWQRLDKEAVYKPTDKPDEENKSKLDKEIEKGKKLGFVPLPTPDPKRPIVFVFEPKFLPDETLERLQDVRIEFAFVEDSFGRIHTITNDPLFAVAERVCEPELSETERVRELIASNPTVRQLVADILRGGRSRDFFLDAPQTCS